MQLSVQICTVLHEEMPNNMYGRLYAYRKAIYEHSYVHYKDAMQSLTLKDKEAHKQGDRLSMDGG